MSRRQVNRQAHGLLNVETGEPAVAGALWPITVRDLLTHTSGLDSDMTGDFGLDRGAIQR